LLRINPHHLAPTVDASLLNRQSSAPMPIEAIIAKRKE
jgi:hypothetical protein